MTYGLMDKVLLCKRSPWGTRLSTWMNTNKMFDTTSTATAGTQAERHSVVNHCDQRTHLSDEEGGYCVCMCYSLFHLIIDEMKSLYFYFRLVTDSCWLRATSSTLTQHFLLFGLFKPHICSQTLKSHHLKQVYARNCFIKDKFGDQ